MDREEPFSSRRYSGGAFYDNRNVYGQITVAGPSLRFTSTEFSIDLPLAGLTLRTGGTNDRTLFFHHPDLPEWTLHTTDMQILIDPAFAAVPSVARQLERIRESRHRSRLKLIAVLVLLVVGIYGFGYLILSAREPLVIAIAEKVPPRWEERMGEAALSQIRTGNRFIEDEAVRELLARIVDPVMAGVPEAAYEFRVHIVDDPAVNAFALPGGIIVLNSGLILAAETPEEVAGVLAHESAHVTLRHGLRQLIATAGMYALVQAFFGDATGLMAVLVDNSALLLTRKYSRDYEREADDTGWAYLVRARIDPRGMIEFFHDLLEMKEEGSVARLGDTLNFLSTHPTTRDRIDRLQDRWQHWEERPSDFPALRLDFSQFQEQIRQATGQ